MALLKRETIARTKINVMITEYLMDERLKIGLKPYSMKEINKFIRRNQNNIEEVLCVIVNEMNQENSDEPCSEWIAEYISSFD
jgi:ABC-type transporter Mla maintaining outer membrane lipid asymmetry ATPase subunit MlaF